MADLRRLVCAAALGSLALAPAHAQQLQGKTEKLLTIETVRPKDASPKPITVTSKTFPADGAIPKANTAYGENRSPQLSWSGAPKGVVSYVVVMEDPDVAGDKPLTHWILGNLPGSTTSLPEGAKAPAGAFQTGAHGAMVYAGPHPPSGLHHYAFQVFALDAKLPFKDGASLADVQAAMTEHVLASGALQGSYTGPG